MSVWTAPVSWSTGAVTAATFNTELRDKFVFLKGALDLITGATTADTGSATQILVKRTASTDTTLAAQVSGDTVARFAVNAAGAVTWGPGGAVAGDVNLYRKAVNQLATDDDVVLEGTGFIELVRRTGINNPPDLPSASRLRLFCQDDGFGKTRLSVRFPTGGTIVIATEL